MDRNETITTLIMAWNQDRETDRQRIVSKSLSDDFSYADPHQAGELVGKRAFLDFLSLFRRRMKGVETTIDGEIDSHHSHARFNFIMKENGSAVSRGTYFADFTESGRISRLIGFFDAH